MTSSVDSHAVPSFYACYLMRSYATASSSRTYIGSTPDPVRRKKQHNGILAQGAHKTKRGRPWETQMIVWGFPSKIAALQFEWAWQKPHMSRHLRTHEPSNSQPSTSQHVPLPLFTDTPMNQCPISSDGCKALSCSSVQSCLLVARALLQSEPFSAWGLRITFFEEYCWAAWLRLERDLTLLSKDGVNPDDHHHQRLSLSRKWSRLGRLLPPMHLTPAPICDFYGVDGTRVSLLSLDEEDRRQMKLESKQQRGVQEGRSPGQWPEKLPKTLTFKAMGGTWDMLKAAPTPGVLIATDNTADAESSAKRPTVRMKLNDEDLAELSWQRYLNFLSTQDLSIDSVRHDATIDLHYSCYLCKEDIRLRDHLTYTGCPSPYVQLQPKMPAVESSALARFGFRSEHKSMTAGTQSSSQHCRCLFHLRCLASHFRSEAGSEAQHKYVLPTHGSCPSCGRAGTEGTNTWVEVIRSVFRRKERLAMEIHKVEAARIRAEKISQKANTTRKRATAPAKVSSQIVTEHNDKASKQAPLPLSLPQKEVDLLSALDAVQSNPKNRQMFVPVSSLLRDPIHSSAIAPKERGPSAKRASLLCNLDSVLNTPMTHSTMKRPRAVPERAEVIDLT